VPGHPNRVAVVDIGSNSTRLLVADVGDRNVDVLERRSQVTRLGRGVDLSGQLSEEAVEAVCGAVADYVSIYQEAGAETVTAIATSAVRDAENGAAFVAELRERFALSARVLDGAEEARLTYLGATLENAPTIPTLIIDIGGGSTELILGTGSEIGFRTSLQTGVVRQTERHLATDPPSTVELEGLAADVRAPIEAAAAEVEGFLPAAAIAVAGTPTSLSAVEMELEPYDSERVHGHVLTLTEIQHQLSSLASLSLAERREVIGLHPDRAPTIVAGIVILVEIMRAFGLEQVQTSEHDILYGVACSALAHPSGNR
jgi:exopolyphosphatase/guanosine-5'-triphosphate,3'-diphosphate pyrophosphatase